MRIVGQQHQYVENPCPVCGSTCEKEAKDACTIYLCPMCGRFQLQTFGDPVRLSEHHKLVLKHYFSVLDKEDKNRLRIITNENVSEIVENIDYPKTLTEKMERILAYIAKNTKYFGQSVIFEDGEKIARLLFCVDEDELINIINYLEKSKFVEAATTALSSQSFAVTITMQGLEHYHNNIIPKLKTRQCFVAMWFNDKTNIEKYWPNMQSIYAMAIKPAIEFEGKYSSIRIDNVEHCNDINDEMISQIRKSRFMVADLTGYRGGVYWEAGFAEGIGIPVIYTCHEKWLHDNKELNIEGVHFDINHRKIILWNEKQLEEFKQNLINRIGANIK